MSVSSFKTALMNAILSSIGKDGSKYNKNTAGTASYILINTIYSYIQSNMTVTVSYSGTLSNGSTDPRITDVFNVISNNASMPSVTSFSEWVTAIQNAIASSIHLSQYSNLGQLSPSSDLYPILNSGLSTFLREDQIKEVHLNNFKDPQDAVWNYICEGLFSWITSSVARLTSLAVATGTQGSITITTNNIT